MELKRDEANMAKLQQLGLTPQDEVKLLSLRDYIIKLAHVISRYQNILISKSFDIAPSLTSSFLAAHRLAREIWNPKHLSKQSTELNYRSSA